MIFGNHMATTSKIAAHPFLLFVWILRETFVFVLLVFVVDK